MFVRRSCVATLILPIFAAALVAQQPEKDSNGARLREGYGGQAIQASALKEWLAYVASDELQGRQVYTEGLGLAAAYIADHLKEWGVKPVGDGGSYFQTVKVAGIKTTSRSSVTVEVNGRSRTFVDGEGITFPRNMGEKQTIASGDVVFAGYGLQIPAAKVDDYATLDPKGKVVIWAGSSGPKSVGPESRRLLVARSRLAVAKGAAAVIGPPVFGLVGGRGRGGQAPPAEGSRGTPEAAAGRGASAQDVDFTTAQRYEDARVTPSVTAQDDFFEFLFSGSELQYSEIKELATKREPLPTFTLKGVKLTVNVDADYTVVNTRLTRNVVGVVEGSDPKLRDTYVAFGAHYDHIGYQQTTPAAGRGGGTAPGGCTGQTRPTPRSDDIVNNGADDDGSGTVALMGLARAFALGPRPKRSLLFVWHTAEESGLQGSRYNADYPVVPIESIVATLNIDMVGRNRCDDPAESNKIYLVGSDRISTELHNLSEDANASLAKPLTLDYELNDPADPESIYTRSDHYSYALKGIPIIFYTTGLHRDYHYVTDEIDKIEFDKLAHITQLVYATGARVANLNHAPVRDNKGPRVGKGGGGKIE
jgi:hypothetical protein